MKIFIKIDQTKMNLEYEIPDMQMLDESEIAEQQKYSVFVAKSRIVCAKRKLSERREGCPDEPVGFFTVIHNL